MNCACSSLTKYSGASKVSLSSISSQELWEHSGRLTENSEVFRFQDRKETRYLLAPTHEEEITALVGGLTSSYKSLPLRLYQICKTEPPHPNIREADVLEARKYRDEPRPRQGLLRGREFVMKDLYTFDYSAEEALKTYQAVKHAYTQLFNELKVPYLVAAADSGNMGGSMSHEFHFISSKGEDRVVSCSHCDHVYNEELADGKAHSFDESPGVVESFHTEDKPVEGGPAVSNGRWMAISQDHSILLRAWYPKFTMQDGSSEPVERHINSHAVKAVAAAAGIDLDLSVENPLERWTEYVKENASGDGNSPQVVDLFDSHVRPYKRAPRAGLQEALSVAQESIDMSRLDQFPGTEYKLNLTRVVDGDRCSQCKDGRLTSNSAVELGHTFHLGTRYSEVLNASVSVNPAMLSGSSGSGEQSSKEQIVAMEMGCHGIGVSRMISAVANRLSDAKGLNWPRAMAPYEVVIVTNKGLDSVGEQVYDSLTSQAPKPVDALFDDRDKSMGWKLGDADLIGYPVIVVVGNGWKKNQTLEVQCRQLGVKEDVSLDQLPEFVENLLSQL